MVSNLAFALPKNSSLEYLPCGEFKLFSLIAKCSLDIVCSTCESNKNYELILMLKMKWMSLILLDLVLAGLESHDLDRTGKS
jgi:hypothetical protein